MSLKKKEKKRKIGLGYELEDNVLRIESSFDYWITI